VGREVVAGDAATGVGVDPDRVEAAVGGVREQVRRAVVGDAELRVRARADLLVVARADAGVHADAEAAVVPPFVEAVDRVLGADGDREVGEIAPQFDDGVEVGVRRVDGGVLDPRAGVVDDSP